MGYEVEIKFRADDPEALVARLMARGARPGPPQDHADHYLAHPGRDFARTDEAVRIRRAGDENRVTYKGPKRPGPAKTREEIEVGFAPGPEAFARMSALFDRLGFCPVATVEKHRRPFALEADGRPLEVTVDHAPGLGDFAEVEAIAGSESDLQPAQEAVAALARSLGLESVEPRSYLRMLLERVAGEP